ncbi:uncharacterized protein [Palaemon carinicauda]|uniref:uncharacterized protein isoform X2 n=1 Tax=Palaemon carinicauda TaxID=392227 RepID=UPI0035B5DCF2
MALRVLVLLLVIRYARTAGVDMTKVMCPDIGECTLQQRLRTLEGFFNLASPEKPNSTPYVGLEDLGNLFARKIGSLRGDPSYGLESSKQQSTRKGKQYYTTDYGTGYATSYPAYSYATGTESSTTFNGLDAALSAIAFLAFGVWLFNLVLPQLQVAGLGVPGLGRRTGQIGSFAGEGKKFIDQPVISEIFTSNQELLDNIFLKDNMSSVGQFSRIKESIFPFSLVKIVENVVSKYAKVVQQAFQDIWKPGEHIQKGEDKHQKKRSLVPKNIDPWTSYRWKVRNQLKGRGLLEDLLGQVWKPFRFITKLLYSQNTDHEFPNSRTETVNGNADTLAGELHHSSDNSLSGFWNGKMNNINGNYFEKSLERKERRRH